MRHRNPWGTKMRKMEGEKIKFGQLILRKIIEIVATRWNILKLKCTKFNFGWGSAPDPTGGAYSAPPDPLAGFQEAGRDMVRTPPRFITDRRHWLVTSLLLSSVPFLKLLYPLSYMVSKMWLDNMSEEFSIISKHVNIRISYCNNPPDHWYT